jgi:hypothetical protein
MQVLAFDIAPRATGACFGGPDGRPSFQTLRQSLDGDEFGPIGTKLRRWVVDLITVVKPDHIAFESPYVASGSRRPGRFTDARIARMQIGLAFLVEQIADEFGVDASEQEVSTVRLYFVGEGRPADPKGTVMRRCRMLGWDVKDDHQGDACALWAYSQSYLDPKFSLRTTPLYGRLA